MKCWLRFLWWLNSLWSNSFSALAGSDTSIFCQDFSPCKKHQSINVQEIFRQISHDNLWIFLQSKLDEKWDLYINITMVMLIQSTGVKWFQLITTISKVEKFGGGGCELRGILAWHSIVFYEKKKLKEIGGLFVEWNFLVFTSLIFFQHSNSRDLACIVNIFIYR